SCLPATQGRISRLRTAAPHAESHRPARARTSSRCPPKPARRRALTDAPGTRRHTRSGRQRLQSTIRPVATGPTDEEPRLPAAHGPMTQTLATPKPSSPPKKPKINAYPWWSPRFWHGMRLGDWLRLCARHRFRIHPLRWPMAALITPCAMFNSVAGAIQHARFGSKIADTKIEQPPLFIIGHWRSGTTLLHELMVLDERYAYPTTYECMAPHHYLLTEWFFSYYCGWLMPEQRPMDNMAAGWKHPQEDEFALLNMGVPSVYERIAFPNHPPPHVNFLDMQDIPTEELERWSQALRHFVQM